MANNLIRYLIVTVLGIFSLTINAFAISIDIDVDKNNKSIITVKDIEEPIYSLQLELKDTNSNTGYTFSTDNEYFYEKVLEASSNGKTNITILVDQVDSFLISSGDLLVGALASTGKPDFESTAKITLVDKNLKSTTQTVNVTVNYSNTDDEDDSNSGGSSSSGSGSSSGSSSSSGSGTSSGVINNPNLANNEDYKETEEEVKEETIQEVQEGKLTISTVKLPEVQADKVVVFNDINNVEWAKDSIEKLAKAGIISGDGKGRFNPSGSSKRADVVIMLIKLLGIEGTAKENFSDVSSDKYYQNYVGLAKQYGIVNGSNGEFKPENNISRQDTMVMVSNILKQLDIKTDVSTEKLKQFNDFDNISAYAQESVAILVNLGIISGSNGNINPKAEVTRAEMSVIICKVYDLIAQIQTN